ncbi:MAG: WSD1 family O-acyltransferase [Nocardiaceae bacterium]|nr:WSD1 family O-acyltransferase [Nocardiaceae bacterium]
MNPVRLSALDAMNYYLSREGRYFGGGDIVSLTVLDSGTESPTIEATREALAARIAPIAALQERVALAPADLAYPHWIADPIPPADKFADAEGTNWDAVLETVRKLPLEPLDPLESTWRGLVWRNVTGAPGIAGRATVIAMKVAHSVTDGRGITQIQRALFGDESAVARVPGHGNPSHAIGIANVVGELMRAPWSLVRFVRVARKAAAKQVPPHDFQFVSELNVSGERYAYLNVRHVAVNDLRWGGSVTETGLTAVSIALEAYLGRLGVPMQPLFAQMPIVPPGIDKVELPVPSGNSASLGIVVDLSAGTSDRVERAERIRQSVAEKLATQANTDHLTGRQLFEQVPVQFVRAFAARGASVAASPWHIAFTSYSKGAANLTLLDNPVAYFAGPPILRPGRALGVTMLGLGDRVTISVGASDAIKAPALFADLLEAAIKREI